MREEVKHHLPNEFSHPGGMDTAVQGGFDCYYLMI